MNSECRKFNVNLLFKPIIYLVAAPLWHVFIPTSAFIWLLLLTRAPLSFMRCNRNAPSSILATHTVLRVVMSPCAEHSPRCWSVWAMIVRSIYSIYGATKRSHRPVVCPIRIRCPRWRLVTVAPTFVPAILRGNSSLMTCAAPRCR